MKKQLPLSARLVRVSVNLLGMVAPGLASSWVYRIWFSTPRYSQTTREQRWCEQAQLAYVDTLHGRVAVYQWGENNLPRVYLVHGWSGRASQLGAFVKPLNDSGFAVIGIDLPGHGLSSGKATNINKMTAALHDVIQQYGEPSHIVAHSFGCLVAALLIRKYASAPSSLVCIGSPTRTEFLVDFFVSVMQLRPHIVARFNRKLVADFGDRLHDELSADENLRNNNLPVFIVHDRQDREVPWQCSQRLADALPDAVQLYTQGLGHRRILRNKQTIAAIVEFIAKNHRAK